MNVRLSIHKDGEGHRACLWIPGQVCREARLVDKAKPSIQFVGGFQIAIIDDDQGRYSLCKKEDFDGLILRFPPSIVPQIPAELLAKGECELYELSRGNLKLLLPITEQGHQAYNDEVAEASWPAASLPDVAGREAKLRQLAQLHKEIAIRMNQMGALLTETGIARFPEYVMPAEKEEA